MRQPQDPKRRAVACAEILEACSAGLDGEHASLQPATVAAHLAACARCRQAQGELARLSRLWRLHAVQPERDLSAAILARIERARRARRSVSRARAAAALVVITAVPVATLASQSHEVVLPTRTPSPCTAQLVGSWRLAPAQAEDRRGPSR